QATGEEVDQHDILEVFLTVNVEGDEIGLPVLQGFIGDDTVFVLEVSRQGYATGCGRNIGIDEYAGAGMVDVEGRFAAIGHGIPVFGTFLFDVVLEVTAPFFDSRAGGDARPGLLGVAGVGLPVVCQGGDYESRFLGR